MEADCGWRRKRKQKQSFDAWLVWLFEGWESRSGENMTRRRRKRSSSEKKKNQVGISEE